MRSSAKRAREEDLKDSRPCRRAKHADGENLSTKFLVSETKAMERFKFAARERKRPYGQSQAAGDSKAVSGKLTSVLDQVSANSILLVGLTPSLHTKMIVNCASKKGS